MNLILTIVVVIAAIAYYYHSTQGEKEEIDTRNRTKLGAQKFKLLQADDSLIDVNGVLVKELKPGEGTHYPTDRSNIEIKYIMMDFERVVLDTSFYDTKTYSSHIAHLLPGWREGIKTMLDGGISEIYIPGHLAYGKKQMNNLQPDEMIIIETELVSVTRGELSEEGRKLEAIFSEVEGEIDTINKAEIDEREEGRGGWTFLGKGLKYRTLKEGKGKLHPLKHTEVMMKYTGRLENGEVFDSNESAQGMKISAMRAIEGWGNLVPYMHVGQRIEAFIPYDMAYGEVGQAPTIPARSNLIFEMELLQIVGESVPKGSLHIEL